MASTNANPKRRHSDSEEVEKEDMSSADANPKRRHSDSEEVEKEGSTAIEIKKQKQENDEATEECTTAINIEKQKPENDEAAEEYMSSADANPKRRHSDSEEVEKEGSTAIEIKKQKQENDEATEECTTAINMEKQKPENDEAAEEYVASADTNPKRRHSDSEEVEKEGTTAINMEKQKPENDEAAEESQEINRIEMATQTDGYDFIWSERQSMLRRLASWTSNVDYHHEISDTWCTVDVTRPTETSNSPHTVYVYNTDGNRAKTSNVILEKFSNQLTGGMLLYHGTDELSAKNIIEQGIDLTMSTRCADFSQGNAFYLMKDYGSALAWAERMVQTSGQRAAVVAFKIESFALNAVTHLSLTVGNDTNLAWWQCVVSHFRRGRKSPDVALVLNDVKYIEGPMAGNFEPELPAPADGGRLTQLCICDPALARTIGSLANTLCVMFVRV